MLVGSAIVLARAVTMGLAQGPAVRGAVLGACGGAFAVVALLDWRAARYLEAEFRVADATLRAAASPGLQRVVVLAPDTAAGTWYTETQLWGVYTRALLTRDLPPVVPATCGEKGVSGGRMALTVSAVPGCGTLGGRTVTLAEYFDYFDWVRLRPARDSIRIDLRCEAPARSPHPARGCVDTMGVGRQR
jgi:hypothetical protein